MYQFMFLLSYTACINIAINSAIIAITTNNSISVNPLIFDMMVLLLFQRETINFASMLACHDYNTSCWGSANYLLIFKSGIARYLAEQIRSEKKESRLGKGSDAKNSIRENKDFEKKVSPKVSYD